MAGRPAHLDVFVYPAAVTVAYRGQTMATFAVSPEHKLVATIPSEAAEAADWSAEPVLESLPVTVDIVTYETKEGSMGLPRANRQRASTRTISPPKRARASESRVEVGETISAQESKQVLNQILRSLRANPHQTRQEIRDETYRIAEACRVKPMAVAGVRANLTRGNYGSLRTLLRKN